MATYDPAIVTFLDILGFRDLVLNSDGILVDDKLAALQEFTNPVVRPHSGDPEESFEPIVHQFSDTVIRVRRIHTKWNKRRPAGLFFHELLDLVYAQIDLTGEDILLRGGISFGDIHSSSGRIFGPALVAAYELESKFAMYPRIVIDPLLLSEFEVNPLLTAQHHDYEDEEGYVRGLTRRGDDGILFVDYATAARREVEDFASYVDFMMQHRRLIENGIKRFPGLNSAKSKYLWLAAYHNSVVSELPEEDCRESGIQRSELLVSSN